MPLLNFISFENFRIFSIDKGFSAKFSDITMITGGNNSGKSSILKFLLMMKDSEIFKINLKGDRHLLGNFGNILSDKQHKEIILTLPFSIMGLPECFIKLHYTPDNKDLYSANLVKIEIRKNNQTLISSEYRNATESETEQDKKLAGYGSLSIKFSYIKKYLQNTKKVGSIYLSKLKDVPKKESKKSPFYPSFSQIEKEKEETKEEREKLLCDVLKTSKINRAELFGNILDFGKEDLEIYLDSIENVLNKEDIDINEDPLDSDTLHEALYSGVEDVPYSFIYSNTHLLLEEIELKTTNNENLFSESFGQEWRKLLLFSKQINYLSSSRGTSSRSYLANSENAFNTIINEYSKHQKNKIFINKWLGKNGFDIAESIKIESKPDFNTNEVWLIIKEGESSNKFSLVDLGYGIMQIVTLMLQISVLATKNTSEEPNSTYSDSILLIEEPEANLHPSWQAKLAGMIAEAATKFKIQFIIETHSEYFIRKFQDLVAQKTIKSSKIKILYLTNPKKLDGDKKQVEEILIEENGSIDFEKFSTGFFDEQYNLSLSLFNTQRDNFITNDIRYIFVEDRDDVSFYTSLYNLYSKDISDDISLVFIPASAQKSGISGGCNQVKEWTKKLRKEGLHLAKGIIDRDKSNQSEAGISVLKRYSIENYFLDPIIIAGYLIHNGIVSEIKSINFPNKNCNKLEELNDVDLQNVADYVIEKVQSSFTTVVNSLNSKREEKNAINVLTPEELIRVPIELKNGKVLNYPKWLINRKGHDLEKIFRNIFEQSGVTFGMKPLIDIIERLPDYFAKDIITTLKDTL